MDQRISEYTYFSYPITIISITINDLDDHTKYIMWLGDSKPLNLEQFL